MTFATLRQTCLQANVLSTGQFGEERTFQRLGGSEQTVRVKVSYERVGPKRRGDSIGQVLMGSKVEEAERIVVTFSRAADWAYALTQPPNPGDHLAAAAGDSDTRAYAFTGEVLAQDSEHGVYVFSRVRKFVGGGK